MSKEVKNGKEEYCRNSSNDRGLQLYHHLGEQLNLLKKSEYYIINICNDDFCTAKNLPSKIIIKDRETKTSRVFTYELISEFGLSVMILNEYKGGCKNV